MATLQRGPLASTWVCEKCRCFASDFESVVITHESTCQTPKKIDAREVVARIERQREHCRAKGLPHFAPANGICFACRRQIYEDAHTDGSSLVTGCPWCARSYCD